MSGMLGRLDIRGGLLVVALGLMASACGGSAPTPTPTIAIPTLPPLPTATLGPSPTLSSSTNVLVPIATTGGVASTGNERVVVINTEGEGANMRIDPSRNAPSVVVVLDGDELEIVGPDRTAEGVTWRNVRDRLGNVGWVSAVFLGPPGSQSTVPTRQATPRATTGPTRPPVTVTVTVAPGTPKPTAPTTPAPAGPKPTIPAPSKPAVPAAGLAVQANVSRPVISSGNQGLHVRVTQGGQPISGARVVAVVQDPRGAKTLDLGATDSAGVATRSFDVGSPQGTITIAITVTTPDGRTANASTSFTAG